MGLYFYDKMKTWKTMFFPKFFYITTIENIFSWKSKIFEN